MVTTQPNNPQQKPQGGLLGLFDQFEAATRENTPSWLQALHKGGIAHFAELGLPVPNEKFEEWRFTNVSHLGKADWGLPNPTGVANVSAANIERFTYPGLQAKRLVFIDGYFAPHLSSKDLVSPQGLRVQSIAEAARASGSNIAQHLARHARYDENTFVALNTGFLSDGVLIHVPQGVIEEQPLHILYLASGATQNVFTNPRTLIIAERDSKVRVIETFGSLSDQPAFTNAVAEIVMDEGSNVEHCKLQLENDTTYHIATIQSFQARSSHFLSHSIAIGGALTRNTINCALEGERVECTLNGLYLGRGTQLVDHHTAIHHNQPNCNSHEFYHGILDDRSHGVFNGKIFVRPEAQKTDAKQTNRNMLLSDDATIDTKPQLEIFADDVRCTHGATIGQLDPESIFYLRSRGISLEIARKMLLHAFAGEIVNRITIEAVRQVLDAQMFELYEK